MKKDKYVKVMLIITGLLLLLNLFSGKISSFIATEANAVSPQKLTFRGNGVSVTCSNDGKYVYAAGSGMVLRSDDYGAPGSWEEVIGD